MTIVTSVPRPKPPRRLRAQPVSMLGPAIVTASRKRGTRQVAEPPDDPEAEARVAAWFASNVRPPGA